MITGVQLNVVARGCVVFVICILRRDVCEREKGWLCEMIQC